jgi:hypothetical protein
MIPSGCKSTIHFKFTQKNIYRYEVEFSIPKIIKPIPGGTTKCYFSLMDNFLKMEPHELEFNFENESLRHSLTKSMRKNMFEVSFSDHLKKIITHFYSELAVNNYREKRQNSKRDPHRHRI